MGDKPSRKRSPMGGFVGACDRKTVIYGGRKSRKRSPMRGSYLVTGYGFAEPSVPLWRPSGGGTRQTRRIKARLKPVRSVRPAPDRWGSSCQDLLPQACHKASPPTSLRRARRRALKPQSGYCSGQAISRDEMGSPALLRWHRSWCASETRDRGQKRPLAFAAAAACLVCTLRPGRPPRRSMPASPVCSK